MKILCTDLDNTIIYSYKHDIGNEKRAVEIYEGREISYITDKTYTLLKEAQKEYTIIPTTTRTVEQYKRINLGIGEFQYALVCNGGILLINGERASHWYTESKELAQDSIPDMHEALDYLEKDRRRKFELMFIEELFVFTKCNTPMDVVGDLKRYLKSKSVEIFNVGEKVYVVPVKLSKGMALKRLRKYIANEGITAAGDSWFDISMVEEADQGIVPYGFKEKYKVESNIFEMPSGKIFSESMLEMVLRQDML